MGTCFFIRQRGGSVTGATLTLTAPVGCTVTVSKDGKSKTKVANDAGMALFKGLEGAEDMRAMAAAIGKLMPGQLKKILTQDIIDILAKYG